MEINRKQLCHGGGPLLRHGKWEFRRAAAAGRHTTRPASSASRSEHAARAAREEPWAPRDPPGGGDVIFYMWGLQRPPHLLLGGGGWGVERTPSKLSVFWFPCFLVGSPTLPPAATRPTWRVPSPEGPVARTGSLLSPPPRAVTPIFRGAAAGLPHGTIVLLISIGLHCFIVLLIS